jgi:hypothetical protein
MMLLQHGEVEATLRRIPEILADFKRWRVLDGDVPSSDHKRATGMVLEYVRKHGLILYGGYAWDRYISNEEEDDEMSDVDILSDHPIRDMKGISDMLYAGGFKHVNAKSSLHEETYSVYLTSQKICDVSYVPSNVFRRLPYMCMEDDHVRLIHPKIVTMDILRMFATPCASYWRLERTLPRAAEIIARYPLVFPEEACLPPFWLPQMEAEAVALLRDVFACRDSILLTGEGACLEYDPSAANGSVRFEVITSAFKRDVDEAHEVLKERFPNVHATAYRPFMSYLGKRVDFSLGRGGAVFATMYDDMACGLTYRKAENGARTTTCFGTMYHLLACNLHAFVSGDTARQRTTNGWLRGLMASRAGAGWDEPLYREFVVACHGHPKSAKHTFVMHHVFREEPSRSWVSGYRPGRNTNLDPIKYHFKNTSGNVIKPKAGGLGPWHE